MQIEFPGFVLSAQLRIELEGVLDRICSRIPATWIRFDLHGQCIGWMPEQHALATAEVLPHSRMLGTALDWRPLRDPSAELQAAATVLHGRGALRSWRGEAHALIVGPQQELLRIERSAFRYFGLRSQAAHVNGVIATGPRAGHWWIARRAETKSVDPGKLDNLAAGGVMADETPAECAQRELGEEAGVPLALARCVVPAPPIHARGILDVGLHDETVYSFLLALPADFTPQNVDGEVAEFMCLSTDELLARVFAGEFTHDAAAVIAAACLRFVT